MLHFFRDILITYWFHMENLYSVPTFYVVQICKFSRMAYLERSRRGKGTKRTHCVEVKLAPVYHWNLGSLPVIYFPTATERADFSFTYFSEFVGDHTKLNVPSCTLIVSLSNESYFSYSNSNATRSLHIYVSESSKG